ncbi:MAG: pre-peptidase C-terminal domain-containing protein [Prochloraceae cyanobacterium]
MKLTDPETCIQNSIDSVTGDGANSLKSLVKASVIDETGSEVEGRILEEVPTWSGVFDVYVEPGLLSAVGSSLDVYTNDLRTEGYDVRIQEFSGSAEELRTELQNRWIDASLEGALFVGDLPFVEFTSEDNYNGSTPTIYPHDLYFMDLDGEYVFNQQGLDSHTGDVGPEIYISRLTASNLGDITEKSEAELINAYLEKVHRVRTGELSYEDRGIIFADDDWQNSFQGVLSPLYSDVDEIRAPNETTRETYIDVLSQNAETLLETIHSWPQGHSIAGVGGGIITSSDIVDINPKIGFLNMFNCSSADFTVPNNLIGAYSFTSDHIINAIGSTKTGSMLNFEQFYIPQASGDSMGQAFLQWFDSNAAPTNDPSQDWKVDWFYGMTMQGDPTLRPAFIGQQIDLVEPNDTLNQASDFTQVLREQGSVALSGFIGDNPNVSPSFNEVDLVLFELEEGEVVIFDTDAAGAGISDLDTILRVFDSSGNELAVNDDSGSLDSEIEFEVPDDGTYAVGVSSYSNFNYDPTVEGSGADGFSNGRFILNAELIRDEQETELVFGTPEDDELNIFDGSVIVFAGDGNDIVDASQSTGNNQLFGGAANDELFASSNNRLFGEAGNDILNAAVGTGNNRLFGGDEKDILFAGVRDRLFGGNGDDLLFAGDGESLLNGGQGADQFWIANAALPSSPNTITDFELDADVLGIGDLGLNFDDLSLTQQGDDALIAALDTDIAILTGIQASDLDSDNFVFV